MDDIFSDERFERWIKVSVGLARFDAFLPSILISLSEIDIDLCKKDLELVEKYKEGGDISKDYISESGSGYVHGSIHRHLTDSYLWILGAYEVVRTLTQFIKDKKDDDPIEVLERFQNARNRFARLRVPLAKLEAAKHHKDTDFRIAYPGFDYDVGIAWTVSEELTISRQELSDLFLETLEFMRSEKVSRVLNE